MQKSAYFTGGALAVAAAALFISIGVLVKNSRKTAYIELHKVFADFEMSKQYKTKLESVVHARKNILDSLELQLSATSRSLQSQPHPAQDQIGHFVNDKEAYLKRREQFEEDNEALQRQYNTEITNQLNQYIKDYGAKNGYDYIYGAEGSGTLMYADKSLNITDKVVLYVNERYHGVNK